LVAGVQTTWILLSLLSGQHMAICPLALSTTKTAAIGGTKLMRVSVGPAGDMM
jgi:hypothetical protein